MTAKYSINHCRGTYVLSQIEVSEWLEYGVFATWLPVYCPAVVEMAEMKQTAESGFHPWQFAEFVEPYQKYNYMRLLRSTYAFVASQHEYQYSLTGADRDSIQEASSF